MIYLIHELLRSFFFTHHQTGRQVSNKFFLPRLYLSFTSIFTRYFQMIPTAVLIRKGVYSHLDSYSAFADNPNIRETKLYRKLKKSCVTDVFVCGIATDVCVGKFPVYYELFQP